MKKVFLLLLIPIIYACNASKNLVSSNENLLMLNKLKKNSFVHVSFLNTTSFGKVACNGLVYIYNNKAILFDTPVDDESTKELVEILETHKLKIKGVVINHFHEDCLGGLTYLNKKGIKSYATDKTILFAKNNSVTIPINGFTDKLVLRLGKKEIINQFVGEAHTLDNIVSYIPSEKIMFGGCMVKEVNAGKGNLVDANEKSWAGTIKNLKAQFPDAEIIIPGHGKPGGQELLDFTIKLFELK